MHPAGLKRSSALTPCVHPCIHPLLKHTAPSLQLFALCRADGGLGALQNPRRDANIGTSISSTTGDARKKARRSMPFGAEWRRRFVFRSSPSFLSSSFLLKYVSGRLKKCFEAKRENCAASCAGVGAHRARNAWGDGALPITGRRKWLRSGAKSSSIT